MVDVVRGASHVGSISSWASRGVSSPRVSLRPSPRLVLRLVHRAVLLLSLSVAGDEAGGAWMSLSSCGHGDGVLFPYF